MLSLKVFLKGGITFSIIVTRSSSLGVDLWTESPGIVASLPSAAAMIRPFMSIGSGNWFHAFYTTRQYQIHLLVLKNYDQHCKFPYLLQDFLKRLNLISFLNCRSQEAFVIIFSLNCFCICTNRCSIDLNSNQQFCNPKIMAT